MATWASRDASRAPWLPQVEPPVVRLGQFDDAIAGFEENPKPAAWPPAVRPLSASELREVQVLLAERGFDVGEIDGLLGSHTRLAIMRFQKQQGMRPDGYPTHQLLQALRIRTRNAAIME